MVVVAAGGLGVGLAGSADASSCLHPNPVCDEIRGPIQGSANAIFTNLKAACAGLPAPAPTAVCPSAMLAVATAYGLVFFDYSACAGENIPPLPPVAETCVDI